MSNFADDIERATSEPVVAAVIGDMGWASYGAGERHRPGLDRQGELLDWDEARPLLDYDYHIGYGAPDCQRVTAWTESFVIFVSQYDGSTVVETVPRNPIAHNPTMPGG